jgi:hypothetical protein
VIGGGAPKPLSHFDTKITKITKTTKAPRPTRRPATPGPLVVFVVFVFQTSSPQRNFWGLRPLQP